jgi:hypothetical protein
MKTRAQFLAERLAGPLFVAAYGEYELFTWHGALDRVTPFFGFTSKDITDAVEEGWLVKAHPQVLTVNGFQDCDPAIDGKRLDWYGRTTKEFPTLTEEARKAVRTDLVDAGLSLVQTSQVVNPSDLTQVWRITFGDGFAGDIYISPIEASMHKNAKDMVTRLAEFVRTPEGGDFPFSTDNLAAELNWREERAKK